MNSAVDTYIHLFNPETDYALATDSENYTPPLSILNMKRSLSLLPALYCTGNDLILVPENRRELLSKNIPFQDLLDRKPSVLSIDPEYFVEMINQNPLTVRFRPWGWNKTLRKWCLSIGIKEERLPSVEEINVIRTLSHRRQTIPFLSNMKDIMNSEIRTPLEFTDSKSAIRFWQTEGDVFFKAPWSSSGRGLLFTKDLELRHIEPWLRGIIHSQGSVMGEVAYTKKIDFATEWECDNGKAMFLGVSTFYTSPRGKYQANIIKSQEEIIDFLLTNTNVHLPGNNLAIIIARQKLLLENYVTPYYSGPLGIDMMITGNSNIHPCVEINIRNTMGRVAIDMFNRMKDPKIPADERNYLKTLTQGGFISPISIVSNISRDVESN
ncbi:MAG: hypothetical protein K2K97_10500 [Muribaculaceae bacterium]|nr:hypothetical protein [Muribaculaceae bacterium]